MYSDCKDASPDGFDLEKEFYRATKRLGVNNSSVLHLKNKFLKDDRQKILDNLYTYNHDYDLVCVGSSFSSHQDHIVVYEEARRAFRGISIWGYQLPNSDYGFSQNPIHNLVTEEDVTAKMEAIKEYESQFVLKRSYFDLKALEGLLLANGLEIGHKYAEKFEPIRAIIK